MLECSRLASRASLESKCTLEVTHMKTFLTLIIIAFSFSCISAFATGPGKMMNNTTMAKPTQADMTNMDTMVKGMMKFKVRMMGKKMMMMGLKMYGIGKFVMMKKGDNAMMGKKMMMMGMQMYKVGEKMRGKGLDMEKMKKMMKMHRRH